MLLYTFVLFFLLTPGVLLTLPPKASTVIVALTHALVFTLLMWLTNAAVWSIAKGNSPAGMMNRM
jgi:hypothetical protein